MHLNVNILLIILSDQCLTIWALKDGIFRDEEATEFQEISLSDNNLTSPISDSTDPSTLYSEEKLDGSRSYHYNETLRNIRSFHDQEDCLIPISDRDYNMPIPFFYNTKPPQIIQPDYYGFLTIKRYSFFKLACIGSKFIWPTKQHLVEIKVRCLNGTLLRFQRQSFHFESFKCEKVPKPKLVLIPKQCQQNPNSVILRMGFQTRTSFLTVYKVCFDMKYKNPLYAWYPIRAPICKCRQKTGSSEIQPVRFFNTTVYGNISLSEVYNNQSRTLMKIIKSQRLVQYYITRAEGEVRFMLPGQLIDSRDFPYYFQQQSTFFYENTVPQWFKFQIRTWRRITTEVDNILTSTVSRRLVVIAGTYDTFSLHNKHVHRRYLYLYLPKSISVPKFFWKMIYNAETRSGIVFLGLNTAFVTYIRDRRICKATMCPGFEQRDDFNRAFVFCCTKESFENVYGRLDSVVYHAF